MPNLHKIEGFKVIELAPGADPEKDEAWLERESHKYPKDDFDREFRLKPVGRQDAYPVFADYQRQHHENPNLVYKPNLRYIYRGWDFGKVHPCVEFLQPEGQKINVVYELYGTNVALQTFASHVMADSGIYFRGCQFVDWGDASGVNDPQSGEGRSCVKILNDMGIRLRYRRADVEEGISKITQQLITWSDGRPNLQVNPLKCPHLSEAMRGGYKRTPKGEIIKDGRNDHPVDAFRYAFQGIQMNVSVQAKPAKKPQSPQILTDCEAFSRRGRV